MDVQMPEMDGLSATVLIRQRERGNAGGGRVPILAMTAHAMTGDRERCLAAGMDDYVAKPLHPDQLLEAVERVGTPRARPAPPQAIPSSNEVPFDVERAIARLGGDRRLLRELITVFRAEAPGLMSSVRAALDAGDCEALWRAAHALKGSLATLGAIRASVAARRVEDAGRRANLTDATDEIAVLEREMIALRSALTASTRRIGVPRKVSKHAPRPARRRPRRR
jgi:HPt (histidine-containing phosphotransfer) domain-containing protein